MPTPLSRGRTAVWPFTVMAVVCATFLFACGRTDTVASEADPSGNRKDLATESSSLDDLWTPAPRPLASSSWIDSQKRRAFAALRDQDFDVLVVPIQAGVDSLDHRGRALMTYALAHAIATRSQLSVADPGLVAKALGLNARQIPRKDINTLAAALGVSKVLTGTVARDSDTEFSVRMSTVSLENGAVPRADAEQVRVYPGNVFSDTSPPIATFGPLRDVILEDSGIPLRAHATERATGDQPILAGSIDELLAPGSAEQAAFALQFFGVLLPPEFTSHMRDQLFERSLVQLKQVNPDSVNYKALRARALLYLGRRPAAIAVLDGPDSPTEQALLAYANGNLHLLTEAVGEMSDGLHATIATIERERLRLDYGARYDSELVEQTVGEEPLWGPLLAHAFTGADTWRPHTHVPLKLALDAMFPVARFDLESYLTGKGAAGEFPDEFDIAALLIEHLNHVERDETPANSDLPLALRADDIIDIYRELLVFDVYAHSSHRVSKVGKPRSALELLEEYDSLLGDHPATAISRLSAYNYLRHEVEGEEKRNVTRRLQSTARDIIELNGALTPEAIGFVQTREWIYPNQAFTSRLEFDRFIFQTDWPQLPTSSVFPLGPAAERERWLRHCLAYTMTDLDCLENLHEWFLTKEIPPDLVNARKVLTANTHRFIGHPQQLEFMESALRRSGDEEAAKRVFLDAIDAGTTQWGPYEGIGRALQKESRFADALNTVLDYPGFADVRLEGAVAQSNRAYDFGSRFYWAGAYEEAIKLYEIAAATQTGSGAEMASSQRLALIKSDYGHAEYHASRRIRRYQSKFAVRDLIGFSAISGKSAQTWSIVNGFQGMFDQPELWVAALVAHRADDHELSSIVEWAYEDGRERLGAAPGLLSARFAYLAQTLDRVPPPDLAKVMRDRQMGLPRDLMNGYLLMIGRQPPNFAVRYRDNVPWGANSELPSLYVYAAEAAVALEQKDYAAAFASLDEAANYYQLREFLPAYAWAAAKTGNAAPLENFIVGARNYKSGIKNQAAPDARDFDESMAEAVLLGLKGEAVAAVESLKAANALIVHNEDRFVLTRYQIMEFARLLFEDTGNTLYRDFALDLARRNAVIEPMQAYAHSFVAMLSDDRRERITALARVLVLDPQSRSIEKSNVAELDEAKGLAARGYPLPHVAEAQSI